MFFTYAPEHENWAGSSILEVNVFVGLNTEENRQCTIVQATGLSTQETSPPISPSHPALIIPYENRQGRASHIQKLDSTLFRALVR